MQKKNVYNPKCPLNVASLNWAIPENIHIIQDIWMGEGEDDNGIPRAWGNNTLKM